MTTLTTWLNKLNRPQIDPCQPPMNWDELEGKGRQRGVAITNFWSIVLDDHWSKMIYRSKMILWSGAIIIHPWMILFIQLWWWWWWLVMMLKGCLLHKQSLMSLGVVQSCAFSKLLHGVCFRIGKHSIVGPSLYHIITHQQTQGCLCIYDQGEL